MRLVRLAALAAAAVVTACSGAPTDAATVSALPVLDRLPTGDQQADRAALDSAYRAVRALAAPGPCADGACASLPLGAKGCGGPVAYVSYCPTSPDAARLRAMAAEVVRAEQAYNARYNVYSTCDAPVAPAGCPVAP